MPDPFDTSRDIAADPVEARWKQFDRQWASSYGDTPSRYDLRELLYAPERDAQLKAAEEQRTVTDLLKSAAKGGVGVLSYLGNLVDKPFAAARGAVSAVGSAVRGDAEGIREGLSQSLLLFPFSESYLRPVIDKTLETTGLSAAFGQVPEEHITGRRVTERLGAPKNKPGFHPIDNPRDALWDALGLTAELLITPPWMPAVGAITKAGRLQYGLAGKATQALEKSREAIRGLAPALTANPAFAGVMTGASLDDDIIRLAKAAGLAGEDVDVLAKTLQNAPESLRAKLSQGIAETSSGGTAALSAALTDLPGKAQLGQAIEQTGPGLASSLGLRGRATEARQGLRAGLSLEPISYWATMGVPQVQIGGPALGSAIDTIADFPLLQWTRGVFDWVAQSQGSRFGQIGAERMTEAVAHMRGAIRDATDPLMGVISGLENNFAKLRQFSTIAGDQIGERDFGSLMHQMLELSHKATGTVEQRIAGITNNMLPGAAAAGKMPDAMEFVRGLYDVAPEFLGETSRLLQKGAIDVGVPRDFLFDISGTRHFFRSSPVKKMADGGPFDSTMSWLGISQKNLRRSSRRSAKHAPGGSATANAASRYLNFGKGVDAEEYAGELFKAVPGRYFYGINDHVRHTTSDTAGRIVNFVDDTTAQIRDAAGNVVTAPIDELVMSMPSGRFAEKTAGVNLTRGQQDSLHREWLNRFAPDDLDGLDKLSPVKLNHELKRRIMANRFMALHKGSVSDVAWAVANPRAINPATGNRWELKEFAAAIKAPVEISPGQTISLSKRQQREMLNLFKSGGSSMALLRKVAPKAGRLMYDDDAIGNLYKYSNATVDLIGAMYGIQTAGRRAAFIPTQKPAAGLFGLGMKKQPESFTAREWWESMQFPKLTGKKKGVRQYEGRPLTPEGYQKFIAGVAEDMKTTVADLDKAALARGLTDAGDLIQIPKSAARELQTMLAVVAPKTPESNFLKDGFKKLTAIYGAWWTYPRISFHLRNHQTGIVQTLSADVGLPLREWAPVFWGAHKESRQFLRAIEKQGPEAALSTLPYADEIVRHNVFGGGMRAYDVGYKEELVKAAVEELPGGYLNWIGRGITEGKGKDWLRIASVPGSVDDVAKGFHPLIEGGRRGYAVVEFMNRVPQYIAARKIGMTPAQALELTKRTQYDYTRLSGIEKEMIRPMTMFYGWTRSNLAYVLPKVTLNLSTKHAQTLRGIQRAAAQQGEAMPEWLQDQMAIPLPLPGSKGKTHVIRSFGLPVGDLAMFGRDAHDTALALLSKTHPFITATVRAATGQDLYLDKPLSAGMSLLSWKNRPLVPDKLGYAATVAEPYIPWASPIRYVKKFFEHEQDATSYMRSVLDFTTGIKTGEYDLAMQRLGEAVTFQRRVLDANKRVRWGSFPYVPEWNKPTTPQEDRDLATFRLAQQFRAQVRQGERRIPAAPTIMGE